MSITGAVLVCAAVFLFFFPVQAPAQEAEDGAVGAIREGERAYVLEEPAGTVPAAGTSSVSSILYMLLILGLTALAVYGVVFFIKRAARPRSEQDPHLRVLARAGLGGTASAAVLAVGTRAWLVGVSEGGVSLLTEIAEQEALDAMFLAESERNERAGRNRFPDFRALFRKVRPDLPPPPGSSIENLRQRRDRIKGL